MPAQSIPSSSLPKFRAPPKTPMYLIGVRSNVGVRSQHGTRFVPNINTNAQPTQKTPQTQQTSQAQIPKAPKYIPRPLSPKELPAQYKGAERKIRTAIVALPIAIVTSYVLYQRIFKGEERKKFSDAVPSV
ncbi:hypothetical protein FPQ18DRAFT_384367 [Pyronema domesticum]|uniref:Uncharacterized protein n=1 Tax=Pyronema omphalodes (strain CBS 100304) TaxID=1076935 RepID=U4LDC4_PYROM|nr:hypothetical protein FPQ18DRAFT_384367 [Pyronema domesticum]CCX12547.1 Similar to predicted protein [Sclerotinia sclerotiorum 1980]; acc. no. XP_001596404 [Pyronema omphalodes CBS 100304]